MPSLAASTERLMTQHHLSLKHVFCLKVKLAWPHLALLDDAVYIHRDSLYWQPFKSTKYIASSLNMRIQTFKSTKYIASSLNMRIQTFKSTKCITSSLNMRIQTFKSTQVQGNLLLRFFHKACITHFVSSKMSYSEILEFFLAEKKTL